MAKEGKERPKKQRADREREREQGQCYHNVLNVPLRNQSFLMGT